MILSSILQVLSLSISYGWYDENQNDGEPQIDFVDTIICSNQDIYTFHDLSFSNTYSYSDAFGTKDGTYTYLGGSNGSDDLICDDTDMVHNYVSIGLVLKDGPHKRTITIDDFIVYNFYWDATNHFMVCDEYDNDLFANAGVEVNLSLTPFVIDYDESGRYYQMNFGQTYDAFRSADGYGGTISSFIYDGLDTQVFGFKLSLTSRYYVGQDATSSSAYQDGYDEGYSYGHDDGYQEGYAEGEDYGYDNGYSAGNTAGLDAGYTAGQVAGYNAGYNDGLNTANQYSFDNLFKSIIDTPIWFLQSIMGFELFGTGTSLIAIVTSLVTLCLLIMLIKKVF